MVGVVGGSGEDFRRIRFEQPGVYQNLKGQSPLAIHWPTAESLKTAGNLSQFFRADNNPEIFSSEISVMIGAWVRIASGVRAVAGSPLDFRMGLPITSRTPEAMRTRVVRWKRDAVLLELHFRLNGVRGLHKQGCGWQTMPAFEGRRFPAATNPTIRPNIRDEPNTGS